MTKKELERRSAAVTLSDMEIFIFPELMFSLVLANIMSPRIWRWREDPWFDGFENLKPYRKIQRLKQFIMDHYAFNLDLDTWGLTDSKTELSRFSEFIDEKTLSQSNALFGYEGDKYYFDIDIRTHFGLDKYTDSVIPYWKTETVEAMDAFVHRENYTTGAGECVSLAALYAAALYIIAEVPLRDIYLMATPLHSQNFVDVEGGILTNNRRLVTKNMWFNGTALSAQARRALENERVTIVSHETGHIHTLYDDATIAPDAYDAFCEKLRAFLKIELDTTILGNFLRQSRDCKTCFQLRHRVHGVDRYIYLEKAFNYENGSNYKVTDNTRQKLLDEIPLEEFECFGSDKRIVLDDLEAFVKQERISLDDPQDVARLHARFATGCPDADKGMDNLIAFCHTDPSLPQASAKQFESGAELGLEVGMDREAVITRLEAIRASHPVADMAFYAYRDLTRTHHEPYLKACLQRSPVVLSETGRMTADELIAAVSALPAESIYDEKGRLAQPDEVWNFRRGDGAEKAVLLANVLMPLVRADACITFNGGQVSVEVGEATATFESFKALPDAVWHAPYADYAQGESSC